MHPIEYLFVPLGRALRNRRPDETASIANARGVATPNRLDLRSPSFDDGDEILLSAEAVGRDGSRLQLGGVRGAVSPARY